jgi:hypothetical protein
LKDNVQKLIQKGNSVKKTRVPIPVLIKVAETLDQKELARIIDRYATGIYYLKVVIWVIII